MAGLNGQGPPGGAPMSGQQRGVAQQQAGGQQQQLIRKLQQADRQQLIKLVLDLRNALMEAQQMQQRQGAAGQQPQAGGQQPGQQAPMG